MSKTKDSSITSRSQGYGSSDNTHKHFEMYSLFLNGQCLRQKEYCMLAFRCLSLSPRNWQDKNLLKDEYKIAISIIFLQEFGGVISLTLWKIPSSASQTDVLARCY